MFMFIAMFMHHNSTRADMHIFRLDLSHISNSRITRPPCRGGSGFANRILTMRLVTRGGSVSFNLRRDAGALWSCLWQRRRIIAWRGRRSSSLRTHQTLDVVVEIMTEARMCPLLLVKYCLCLP